MSKILVVDDEPDLRFILRRIFEGTGHEVADASNGAEALVGHLEPFSFFAPEALGPRVEYLHLGDLIRSGQPARLEALVFGPSTPSASPPTESRSSPASRPSTPGRQRR